MLCTLNMNLFVSGGDVPTLTKLLEQQFQNVKVDSLGLPHRFGVTAQLEVESPEKAIDTGTEWLAALFVGQSYDVDEITVAPIVIDSGAPAPSPAAPADIEQKES